MKETNNKNEVVVQDSSLRSQDEEGRRGCPHYKLAESRQGCLHHNALAFIRAILAAARSSSPIWPIILALIAWLALCAVAGCQNEFRVRVEKLDVAGRRAGDVDDPDSTRQLATLHEILLGLDGVCVDCQRETGMASLSGTMAPLGEAQQAARTLLPSVESALKRQSAGQLAGTALTTEVDLLRRQAVARLPDLSQVAWDELIEAQTSPEKQMKLAAAVEQWRARLARYAADLSAVSQSRPGFGGFQQAGVYRINPGDPHYDAVLKAKAIGSPLTAVSVAATGDSGFMIVQESPGQMRLYELTNDPIALTRNVSFIIDKVLQAAVKFGG